MIQFNPSKILIPVDFSETSLLAIKHGAFIAQYSKSDLFLLHVVNLPFMSQNLFLPLVNIEDQSEIENKVTMKLSEISKEIQSEYGVQVESIIKIGSPSSEITNVAQEIGATMIVMGTHGYSPLEELVIGSVALKVITKSSCPTMAMSVEAAHKGYNKIVIPIDTTANSRQKVNFAIGMAKKFNATLHAIALLGADEDSEKPAMELILHQVENLAKEKDVTCHTEVLSNLSNRATATVEFTEKVGGDLIVIMTDQDAELSGFFLGPYSQQIIHKSKVPVIAIKPNQLFVTGNIGLMSGTSGS